MLSNSGFGKIILSSCILKGGIWMKEKNKEELLAYYKRQAPIPDKITIHDVVELLKVSKKQVIQMIETGEIQLAKKTVSGRWQFNIIEFVEHPNFLDYVEQRKKRQENSLLILDAMSKLLKDE